MENFLGTFPALVMTQAGNIVVSANDESVMPSAEGGRTVGMGVGLRHEGWGN